MKRASWLLVVLAVGALFVLVLRHERTESEPLAPSPAARAVAETPPQFAAEPRADAPVAVSVAENTEAAASAGADAGTVIMVRHADGVPARNCEVVLARGDEVVWSEVADVEGTVRAAAVAGSAVVWVGGVTLAPVSFPLAEARGRHELTLPAGESIDGRIVVDGGPPPEPVPLWLTPMAEVEVPEGVRAAMTPWRPGKPRLEAGNEADFAALVGGDGSYRFSGLPVGWTGRFNVPYTWVPDETATLDVRAPEYGRLIALHRIPHVRFRVVTEGTREPVPFAAADVTRSASGTINEDSIVCDADGRADVPFVRWERTLQVTLDLANAEGTARALVQRDIEDSSHDVDLGDIELSSRASIPFRVTEPDGTPIAGAVAATECQTLIRSGQTDAMGLGQVDGVPPGCTEMRVGAPRHEPALVELPAQPPTKPMGVTLSPCAWLGLRVRTEDGTPRPGLTLRLETHRHVSASDAKSAFFGEALEMSIHVAAGSGSSSGTDSVAQPDGSVLQKRTMAARLWKLGDFELGCMEPGQPVSLSLVDDAQTVLWSDEVTLQAGEQRQLEAVLSASPQLIEAFVNDENGAPVDDASLRLRATAGAGEASERWSAPVRTDATGHATFAAVYTPSVDVRAEKAGYLTSTQTNVMPGVPGHITLRRGLASTVHCVDGKGRPVLVNGVWAVQGPTTLNGEAVDAQLDENGRPNESPVYHLVGLAPGPVSVQTRVGGRGFAFEHQASESEITIVLPESGALVVRGLQAAKGVEQAHLRVGLQGEQKVFLPGWLGLGEIARDEIRWPVVFPGTYRVELVAGDDTHVLAGPTLVDVRVGETAEVSLH